MNSVPAWPRIDQLHFSGAAITDRKTYLGGSDLYRLRKGEWKRLWEEKTGRCDPENLTGNLRVQISLWTEEFIRQWIERELDITVRRDGIRKLHRDPNTPWRAAHHDGMVTLPDGRDAPIDFKFTGLAPDYILRTYRAQLHHEMAACSCDVALIAAVHCNAPQYGSGLATNWSLAQMELDPPYLAQLTEICADFWHYVETDERPRNRKGPLF